MEIVDTQGNSMGKLPTPDNELLINVRLRVRLKLNKYLVVSILETCGKLDRNT